MLREGVRFRNVDLSFQCFQHHNTYIVTYMTTGAVQANEDHEEPAPSSPGTLSQDTLVLGEEPRSTAKGESEMNPKNREGSRQSGLTSFFNYSKGMTEKDMRFCCATQCHENAFAPPTTYPPKPKVESLADMMGWAHDFHDAVQRALPNGALNLLAERLSGGSYSTAFSGIDCPGSVAWKIFNKKPTK